MESNTTDQILNLIDKSQNILLLTHARADCDGLGAMLSLYLILNELGKNVTAVTNDPTPENLAFLPSISIVQSSMASSKDFIISLDLSKTPLSKIKYNMEGNQINIIITPKGGGYTKEDVSFKDGGNKYDLIIVLDAGNLEHLGPIYDQNSELFFETPIINIDHHSSNNDFGQVNMVDMVAASTTEVLYPIIKEMEKKYDKKFLTEDISTLLLAGIITDTGSFQHANTSPKSMEVAAKLLDYGARQQEIIKNIYKTKKLSTLKLWGIVLSKVQVDPIYRMVWSTISKDDLTDADAESNESESIIDDLLTNAPGAEVIMLIKYNEEGYTSVSMRSTTNAVDVGQICADMGGGGHIRAAGYKIRNGQPFDQVISEALSNVRKYQSKRLNIQPGDINIPEPKVRRTPDSSGEKEDKPDNVETNRGTSPKKETTYLDFKKPTKSDERAETKGGKKKKNFRPKAKQAKQEPRKPFNKVDRKPEPPKIQPTPTPAPKPPKPAPPVTPAPALRSRSPESSGPQPPKPELKETPPEIPDWLKSE